MHHQPQSYTLGHGLTNLRKGFWGTTPRIDVLGCSGLSLQMARGGTDDNNHHWENTGNTQCSFCCIWIAWADSVWQWAAVYFCWIRGLYDEEERYQTHTLSTRTPFGEAEHFVQTFKRTLKAGKKDGGSLQVRLSRFLLVYRSTSDAMTGVSPAELFLKQQLRTLLDLLHPLTRARVSAKQADQKKCHNQHSQVIQFETGQPVLVKNLIMRRII